MSENQGNPVDTKAVEAPAAPAGGFARSLYEIFTDPAKVFARIDAGLSWWKPFVAICAGTIATQMAIAVPFGSKLMELQLGARNLSPEQMDRMAADMEKYRMIGLVTAPMVPILAFLVTGLVAALLAYVICNVMTQRATFGKTLSLVMFCGLFGIVEQIVVSGVLLARGVDAVESISDMMLSLGPAAFFPTAGGAFLALLQSLSLFQVWSYVVLVLGFAALFRVSRMQAVIAAIPVWAVHYAVALFGVYMAGKAA